MNDVLYLDNPRLYIVFYFPLIITLTNFYLSKTKIIYSVFFFFHIFQILNVMYQFFLFVFKIDSSNDEDKEKFPR